MIVSIIYTLLANALALFVSDKLLDGLTINGGYIAFIIVGFTIAVLNYFVKPVLKFLAFPLVFFSAGLFLFAINAFIIYLAKYLIDVMDISNISIQVDNLLTYVLAAIIFGLANWFISWLTKN